MSEYLWILTVFILSMLLWILLSGAEEREHRKTEDDEGWWDA